AGGEQPERAGTQARARSARLAAARVGPQTRALAGRVGGAGQPRSAGPGTASALPRPPATGALAGDGHALARRRNTRRTRGPPAGDVGPGAGLRATQTLPLRRLRVRGTPALLAMPRLPGLGQLPGPARGRTLTPPQRP